MVSIFLSTLVVNVARGGDGKSQVPKWLKVVSFEIGTIWVKGPYSEINYINPKQFPTIELKHIHILSTSQVGPHKYADLPVLQCGSHAFFQLVFQLLTKKNKRGTKSSKFKDLRFIWCQYCYCPAVLGPFGHKFNTPLNYGLKYNIHPWMFTPKISTPPPNRPRPDYKLWSVPNYI